MPVRFKGKSEYDKNYTWRDSFRSRSFQPTDEQLASSAGGASCALGPKCDPPMQRKKRVGASQSEPILVSTTTADMIDQAEPPLQRKKKTVIPGEMGDDVQVADPYMLLGSQSKFSSNIVYRSKSRERPFVARSQDNYNEHESNGMNNGHTLDTPETPLTPRGTPPNRKSRSLAQHQSKRDPNIQPVRNPAPVVNVNTGAPSRQPHDHRGQKSSNAVTETKSVKPGILKVKKPGAHGVGTHGAAPQPPVDSRSEPSISKSINRVVDKPTISKKQPDHVKTDKAKSHSSHGHHSKKVGAGHVQEEKTKQAELVPANLEKKIAYSSQQAQADYAMQYKHGIAAPREQGPKRLSEYQKQFKWKKSEMASPMLAAEQVVYSSSTQLKPMSSEKMPTRSEYQMQFKPWNLMQSMPEMSLAPEGKIKSARSLEDLRTDAVAPKRPAPSEEDKRLLKESLNPQRLHFPHGKFRKEFSEYKNNFQAPNKYQYEEGAWQGADPPHLQPYKGSDSVTSDDLPAAPVGSWFNEVVELRERAKEYQKRARGTHFSHQHLAQLYAQQTAMWDSVSQSSTLSALSLEPPGAQKLKDVPQDASERGSSDGTFTPASGRQSVCSSVTDPVPDNASSVSSFVSSSSGGRLPTPTLRASATTKQARHHLDRTTPSVGGALLTSPPRVRKQTLLAGQNVAAHGSTGAQLAMYDSDEDSDDTITPRFHTENQKRSSATAARKPQAEEPDCTCGADEASAQKTMKHQKQKKQMKKGRGVNTPVLGMPTRDTHLLVDDDDRPMSTKYVHTPQGRTASSASGEQRIARQKFPQADVPSTIPEQSADTYSKHPNLSPYELTYDDIPRAAEREIDDDLISLSNRSVASSCSMASEVLERARQRRDEFWRNPQGLA